jgi:protein tyrosine phosphatase
LGSDYINASFVDGYTSRRAYIATQGPLENTLADFWRMAWEREIDIIVMLTELVENGRAKSDQYWPDADEGTITLGDFQVVLDNEYATDYGFERSVTLIDLVSETSRRIKQFQYVKWPESDVKPDAAAVRSLLASIKVHQDSKIVLPEENIYGNAAAITEHAIAAQIKPILVHDSAGVGRTGAFCALHISMKKLDLDGKVDVFTVVKHMRTQRMSMVQTPSQYEWVYSVLNDCVQNRGLTEQLYVNVRQASMKRRSNGSGGASPPVPPPKMRQQASPGMPAVQETSLMNDSFGEPASL